MTGSTPQIDWVHSGQTLHLNHGPIDLLVRCEGCVTHVQQAYAVCQKTFSDVLPTLVQELCVLRSVMSNQSGQCDGPVARRMQEACQPFLQHQVTPMAAVAGAVADHMLAALVGIEGVTRAWVNNGGDIALYLTPGQQFDCGIVSDVQNPAIDGQITLTAEQDVAGVATSGWALSAQGGRSFSLGIADSVTVLAKKAATADVAATVIANAVDLPAHPQITRALAQSLDPDSDLGERLVTTAVGELSRSEIATALQRGWVVAQEFLRQGLIHSALLSLRGQRRSVQGTTYLLGANA